MCLSVCEIPWPWELIFTHTELPVGLLILTDFKAQRPCGARWHHEFDLKSIECVRKCVLTGDRDKTNAVCESAWTTYRVSLQQSSVPLWAGWGSRCQVQWWFLPTAIKTVEFRIEYDRMRHVKCILLTFLSNIISYHQLTTIDCIKHGRRIRDVTHKFL